MRSVFQHWVNMGHDGFMLDWPQGYVGRNTSSTYGMPGCTGGDGKRNTCDPTIIEAIKSFVEPLGDIAVMGEAYNDVNTNWPFLGALRHSSSIFTSTLMSEVQMPALMFFTVAWQTRWTASSTAHLEA